MLKNYLLIPFRNLLKNKIFTLINIAGPEIALAVCIVATISYKIVIAAGRNPVESLRYE
jgi:hypothetical protein